MFLLYSFFKFASLLFSASRIVLSCVIFALTPSVDEAQLSKPLDEALNSALASLIFLAASAVEVLSSSILTSYFIP